jgi:hypothetical protein
MSNPYYTYSGAFIPGTLARAEAEAAEFQAVQAGFALLVTLGIDTGSTNAYVVTTQGQPTVAYADGNEVLFKATTTNNAAATINVNGIGVVSIFRYSGAATQAGDLVTGTYYTLVYNSTYGGFTIIGPAAVVSFSGTISASPPVHLVGLVAAGGVSTSAVPIDATYAIDQGISPTWTGAHIFNGSISGTALTNYLLAPAAIGTTTPAAGKFTTLTATGALAAQSTLAVTGNFTSKIITDNGNVTIAAPASGVTLAVSGLIGGSSQAMTIQGGTTSGDAGLLVNAGTSSGSHDAFWLRNAAATATLMQVGGSGSFAIGWNGTNAIVSAAAAGNVTITAPTSGRTLVLDSVSGDWALSLIAPATTTPGAGILFTQNASVLAEVGLDGGQSMLADSGNSDLVIRSVGKNIRFTCDGTTSQMNLSATAFTALGNIVLGTNSSSTVRLNMTTASTVGAAGAATALPAQPLGYLAININATNVKIPYYNN